MKRLALALCLALVPSAHGGNPLSPGWNSGAAIMLGHCQGDEDCYITLFAQDGTEIVRISQRTGKATVAHPERSDEAAEQFWRAIEYTFGKRCPK